MKNLFSDNVNVAIGPHISRLTFSIDKEIVSSLFIPTDTLRQLEGVIHTAVEKLDKHTSSQIVRPQ